MAFLNIPIYNKKLVTELSKLNTFLRPEIEPLSKKRERERNKLHTVLRTCGDRMARVYQQDFYLQDKIQYFYS